MNFYQNIFLVLPNEEYGISYAVIYRPWEAEEQQVYNSFTTEGFETIGLKRYNATMSVIYYQDPLKCFTIS